MPKVVSFPKTKAEREAEKQRVKTLYYSGQSLSDAARAVGVTSEVARQWAVRHGWTKEIQEVQQLAQSSSRNVTPDRNIAFDIALTKKETRASFARTSLKIAQWAEQEAQSTPEVLFEMGSQYKAHVESAAKVAGDWEDSSANRFAVAIQVNGIDARIRKVPLGVTIEES